MPTKTVQKFLHRNLKYLHACQKGLLTKTDIDKHYRLLKRWKEIILQFFGQTFLLRWCEFFHKYNHADQARAPSDHIWRKQQKGLAFGCTAEGSRCSTCARVGKLMVALSYGKGVVLCEQYETLNRQHFKSFIEREFARFSETVIRGGQNYLCKTMIIVKTRH